MTDVSSLLQIAEPTTANVDYERSELHRYMAARCTRRLQSRRSLRAKASLPPRYMSDTRGPTALSEAGVDDAA